MSFRNFWTTYTYTPTDFEYKSGPDNVINLSTPTTFFIIFAKTTTWKLSEGGNLAK